jgi:heme-binding NEAT domain protein
LIADWAAINQSDWFTPFGLEIYCEFKVALEDKNKTRHQLRTKAGWTDILKNSKNVGVFAHETISAHHFMEYVSSQANQKTRKPLSKAGYGSKRSTFFHLV